MPHGATLTLDHCFRLAQAWYSESRAKPEWRRRTVEETRAVFESLSLTGDFWRVG